MISIGVLDCVVINVDISLDAVDSVVDSVGDSVVDAVMISFEVGNRQLKPNFIRLLACCADKIKIC